MAGFSSYILESTRLDNGPPVRYQLQTERVNLDKLPDAESKLRRFTVGKKNPANPNRTILLVGATGSGKSTLINALVNFVMGVKFEDKVWFEIIVADKDRPETDSQTSEVSVYEVFGFEGVTVPYSLTIIDTPGYGDTRGIKYDDIVTKKLQDLFCSPEGVDVIDAVGLVLKATENRLDERMAYIFNSVTSLFSKNMETNIVVMMTHSDGMKPKNAIQALNDAKIKCARDKNKEPVFFQFNNRQKEMVETGRSAQRAAQHAFETSEDGMLEFTEFLGKCQPQNLKTCVEVMKERIRLTACMQNLQERVTTIENKQEAIKQNKEELSKYEQEMKENKNFTFNETETYKEKEDIDSWWDNKAVTCNTCKENCHYPGCTWAWDPSWCEVMKDGKCTSCSGKCPVEDHVKEGWKYVTKKRIVKKTKDKMKEKYEKNKTESEKKTTLLEDLEEEISDLQQTKDQYLDEAFDIIEQLEKIALNVNAVSTFVHLDFLIEKMREKGDTEKVQKLERMKGRMDERNKAGAMYFLKSLFKR